MMTTQRLRRIDLLDAVAIHQKQPKSLPIASDSAVGLVKLGDHVKVGVVSKEEPEKVIEHFWICITSIEEKGKFIGYVDNEPEVIKNLKKRDYIGLTRNNIIDTLIYKRSS